MRGSGGQAASPSSSSSSATELPLSQRLVKVLGNLCFTAFVLSVLIFAVVAVTYQPPDPWFDSARSITKSLADDILPNATFRTDDSLLPTGEDLIPLPLSNLSSLPPIPSPTLCPNASADETPFNCSNPRVLAAIRRFNSKVFRRSIVFLSYETPVPGSRPGECDAAWRFRNRREKSWRRYRDYRRFRLAPADNCTYAVVSAGKFRSGTNAAPRPRIHKPSSASAPPVLTIADAEINDTIPTLGSASEFLNRKYLYYTRGGDHCKSMNQYMWSFLCGLGEAMYLNRTFVMDLSICLAAAYNPSGLDEEGKDFRFYFDFEHLEESAQVVEEGEFLRDWHDWERTGVGKKSSSKFSVRKVPTYKVTPMQLRKDQSSVIWRQFDGPEPENYWYRVCEGRAAKYIQRPWQALWKSKRLMNIVSEIAGKMDWDYDAVHVVRGEKAKDKELWPNLDADTSPDALLEKLIKLIQPWRNLFIATNEPFYSHFDKLRSHFHVHLLDDYNYIWGNTSEWFNETLSLNNGRPVEFDGYMRVAVDTEVLYRAKVQVETFNNLTRDCKDGIHTC